LVEEFFGVNLRELRRNNMAKKKARTKAKTKAKPRTKTKRSGEDVYDRMRRQHQDDSRGGDFFRFKGDGRYKLRIFMFEHNGQEDVFVKNSQHFNLVGDKKVVRCPGWGDCPICDLKEDVPTEVWEGKGGRGSIKPSNRYLCNAVVRNRDGGDDEQCIVDLPYTVWDAICKAVDTSEIKDPFHPKKGIDFQVLRTTKNRRTGYETQPIMKRRPIGMDVEPKDLIAMVGEPLSPKELQRIADAISEERG